jgi:hypothetical protein
MICIVWRGIVALLGLGCGIQATGVALPSTSEYTVHLLSSYAYGFRGV